MAEVNMENAKRMYETLISYLDRNDWNYEKKEEKLLVNMGIKGEDLPINLVIAVNAQSQVVQVISHLSFEMPEDKRVDGAIAVCIANYGLVNGSFDYDLSDGSIWYRLSTGYAGLDSLPDELFEYMIGVTAGTVDRYNDKFFMISKGMLTLEQFMEQENS